MSASTFQVDDELEREIDRETLLLHTVQTPEERRMVWERLTRLVESRSPERVRHMERTRLGRSF